MKIASLISFLLLVSPLFAREVTPFSKLIRSVELRDEYGEIEILEPLAEYEKRDLNIYFMYAVCIGCKKITRISQAKNNYPREHPPIVGSVIGGFETALEGLADNYQLSGGKGDILAIDLEFEMATFYSLTVKGYFGQDGVLAYRKTFQWPIGDMSFNFFPSLLDAIEELAKKLSFEFILVTKGD